MKKILFGLMSAMLVLTVGCYDARKISPTPVPQPTQSTVTQNVMQPQSILPEIPLSSPIGKTTYSRAKAKVTRVIDGDTIETDLNGVKTQFRLLLVDTPETKKPGTPIQPFGPEASEFIKKLLLNKEVGLEIQSGLDKYNRGLAYVYIDGKSVQEQLILNGFARVAYVYIKNAPHLIEYQKDEQLAKNEKIGIWSIDGYVQEDGFHPEVIER
ncbi:MAG: putative nuclease precursor [Bacillales bacterium]|jgi:micrococcal nuclease|nr:putative nuclease precursor [Bacillales bacterium]